METRASVKGQIVIPISLSRKYGIKAGTQVALIDTGESIVLKPVTEESLRRLQDKLRGKGTLRSLMRKRRRDQERE